MLRKFASFEVLEATLAPENDPLGLQRYAHRHSFSYDPRPGYLYVRSRAISSRTNDNFDTFPAEEIKKSYASFIGKPVFVNHNNDNHRRARGVVIDAALHDDRNPDGSPDTWCEVLMEVDAVRFPKLAKAILAGHIDRTSMGTDVAYSLCSFCGNKATTPLEYCGHIPKLKGKRIYRTTASGQKEGVLVSEICHGLKFFENSLLVEEPADPTAYFTGVDDHSKTASKSTNTGRCDICGVVRELARSVRNQSVCVSCHQRAQTKTAMPYDPEVAARQQAARQKADEFRSQGLCDCPGSTKIEPHKPSEHSDWATKSYTEGKTDAWGHPLMQPFDGHGAWSCNNYSCAEHPQSLYDDKGGAQSAPGWMKAEHDPHKDLAREVGKAFHESGTLEDGRYLLDQHHDGPSHLSSKVAMPGKFPTEHEPQKIMTDEGWAPGCSVCGQTGPALGDDHIMAHLQSVLHTNQVAWDRGLDTGAVGTPMSEEKKKEPKKDDNVAPYVLQADRPENAHLFHNVGQRTASSPGTTGDESKAGVGDTSTCATCGKAIYQVEDGSMGWQHDIDGASGVPHQALPKKALLAYAALLGIEAKGPAFPNPADHPSYQALGVSHQHILDHWDRATDEEKSQGARWYADAHHVAKAIAGGDAHKGAGVLSAYSPQTNWPANMFNAARSFAQKRAVGKGEGLHVMGMHHTAAQRILEGEDHQKVLSAPKTNDFAHLIEHGGNDEHGNPSQRVCIDRHAMSVAAGRRLHNEDDIDHCSKVLGTRHYYEHTANMYRNAASIASAKEGRHVPPHEMQAVTWLVRQRLNHDEINGNGGRAAGNLKGRMKSERNSHEKFRDTVQEHHPDLYNQRHDNSHLYGYTAGQVYLAYGETKAPEDVDTLRDEECPVCGESDAYDGNRCDVCGFDAPPKMFQDPDLGMAKQLDLRKDIVGDEMADPNNDGMPDVIPGSGQMGGDAIPMDPSAVPDPNDVAQQQVNQVLDQQAPLDPTQLDENGQPIQGANPLDQALPQDPNAMPMDPNDVAGADPLDDSGMPEPGTPGDAVADLVCPVCGYQQGAEAPQSVDMDSSTDVVSGADGALCPQCGQAPLMSTKDANAQMQQMGQPPIPAAKAASLDQAFPVFTI